MKRSNRLLTAAKVLDQATEIARTARATQEDDDECNECRGVRLGIEHAHNILHNHADDDSGYDTELGCAMVAVEDAFFDGIVLGMVDKHKSATRIVRVLCIDVDRVADSFERLEANGYLAPLESEA